MLRDKPGEMLDISPKGTVPVLLLPDGRVIDESLDVMFWALNQYDPLDLLKEKTLIQSKRLIEINDQQFKPCLDRYKYAIRFPEKSQQQHRELCSFFLQQLDGLLQVNHYLLGNRMCLADIAIFPFIRQFAGVDSSWFYSTSYTSLHQWLQKMLDSELFKSVMTKYQPWLENKHQIVGF